MKQRTKNAWWDFGMFSFAAFYLSAAREIYFWVGVIAILAIFVPWFALYVRNME